MPGPVPNREADLARPRSHKGQHVVPVTKGVSRPVRVPRADPQWHPIAKMLWDSMKKSGQADFYQQSDWAFAYSLCDDLSYYKNPGVSYNRKTGEEYVKPRSGQMLQTIYAAMGSLLITEGDRRRVRIELHEPEPDKKPASVVAIAGYRDELGLD